MQTFTINNFWKPRLTVQRQDSTELVKGWSFEDHGLNTFMEAPLSLSSELGPDIDPNSCSILLVSAPGAVGKSTLARQIAFNTGAVYIDLAQADPVGGNTLSGGLVKSRLYESWQAQTTALLVDGLDEGRLRVTQDAFRAFLGDVVDLSRERKVPIVLFGRTGAVQDSWLLLTEHRAEPAILEIGYYGAAASVEFAEAKLRAAGSDERHLQTKRRAIELLLERLRQQTESDGDRFAGYAPVLQAIAERVARELNAAAFLSEIERGAQPVTLKAVGFAILEREQRKLDQIAFEDPALRETLYLPEEQLVPRHRGFDWLGWHFQHG